MINKPIVHVIDADPEIRNSIADFLTAKGFGVRTYASANDFLDSIGSQLTGCVVADLHMPGISGIEFIAKMKERLALPIIIITAHADIPLAVQAMKQGAVDLLRKPLDNDGLVRSICQTLARGSPEHPCERIDRGKEQKKAAV